jgi:tRNA A-37 threonylcarbamoyl transferase component Bud32/TolB-like protein
MPSVDDRTEDDRPGHAETLPVASAEGRALAPAGRFAVGTLVAERYRVVRALGQGGMGDVHEAEDLLLGVRVALKTIRRPVARDEATILRFRREIQLARTVTHPNVCRIFDLGVHEDAPFVTMELLSGETLASRLKRGRPNLDEAELVATQLARALAAAHEVGVIHRDFKPANVMLVKRAGHPGVRAVVTDFGLARALEEDPQQALTGDGGIVGSPAYMAPEQVEGKRRVTEAADIYALGVVLFELTTGRLPFHGETLLETMTLRLREPPPPPRSIVPDLPERWERTILRCLEREPAQRFVQIGDVPAELSPQAAPARSRRALWLAPMAIAALSALWLVRPRVESPSAQKARSGRPAVAVIGLRNLSGRTDADYLATQLALFIATHLSAGERVRTIDGESIVRARRELALPDTDSFATDTLARLRARLGNDYVVVGAYAVTGDDRLHVDLRLQDTRSGATVAAIADDGTRDDVPELVSRLGAQILARLDVGELSETQRKEVAAALPKQPAVQRLYAEGLAQLGREACSAARAPLEQAVAAEPGFAPARSALSEALSCLGFTTRAEEEAKKAVELSAALPGDAKLAARAHLLELTQQFAEARNDYETLFQRHPDDVSFAQRLLRLQVRSEKLADARATLASLRRLPGGDTADTDLRELTIAMAGGMRYSDMLAALENVRARAEKEGERLVVSSVLLEEARIHVTLGQLDRGRAAAAGAKAIFQAAADHDGELLAMTQEVEILQRVGDLEGLRHEREVADAVARGLEGARSFHDFEAALAAALARQGDLTAARTVYEELRDWCRSRGRKAEEAKALQGIADVLIDQAELPGARRTLDEAEVLVHDRPSSVATLAASRGRLALLEGDLIGARANFATVLSQAGGERDSLETMIDGPMLEAEGRLAAAEAAYRRSYELAVQKAGRPAAVQHLPWLGNLLIDENKLAEAHALLDRITPEERAAAVANRGVELSLDATALRLRAYSGQAKVVADSERELGALAARARAAGFVLRALQIELMLGRVQIAAGQPAGGRATLTAVAHEAHVRGAELIARKAEVALRL